MIRTSPRFGLSLRSVFCLALAAVSCATPSTTVSPVGSAEKRCLSLLTDSAAANARRARKVPFVPTLSGRLGSQFALVWRAYDLVLLDANGHLVGIDEWRFALSPSQDSARRSGSSLRFSSDKPRLGALGPLSDSVEVWRGHSPDRLEFSLLADHGVPVLHLAVEGVLPAGLVGRWIWGGESVAGLQEGWSQEFCLIAR